MLVYGKHSRTRGLMLLFLSQCCNYQEDPIQNMFVVVLIFQLFSYLLNLIQQNLIRHETGNRNPCSESTPANTLPEGGVNQDSNSNQ